MKKMKKRQEVICQMIVSGRIHSQEQLLALLREQGMELTQATLSRDLKMMKVVKVPDKNDEYIYMVQEDINLENREERLKVNFLAEGFRDLQFSGNLAVIRTLPGYASSLAVVIDSASPDTILSTIAGDDTILIILKEGVSRSELVHTLVNILPYLKTKIG
jgi:transcriptional regulator of arginine metabolism